MTFVKLSIFTILLSIFVFEIDGARHPIYRRAVAKTYNSNKFVGEWHIIGILHIDSLPNDVLNCAKWKVEKADNHEFHITFTGMRSQENVERSSTATIENDKITEIQSSDHNLNVYTIYDYENSDEIVLQIQPSDSYLLLSRTLNVSETLWKKYSDLGISKNGNLVRETHEDCA